MCGESRTCRGVPMATDDPTIKAYASRWMMLAIFMLGSAVNSQSNYTFAPIAAATADFYGVSFDAVNAFGAVFLGLFVPGAILGSYITVRRVRSPT